MKTPEVQNGQPPYLITWDLPLILEYLDVSTESLEPLKQLLIQGLSALVLDAPIWVVESTELRVIGRQLVEEAKRQFPQALFVSMDQVYFPDVDARLEVTRLLDWDTRLKEKPVRALGARPGNSPLARQIQNLSQNAAKQVVLTDAGVFDGGTFNRVKTEFEANDMTVDAFIGAIASPIAPSLHAGATR